MTQISNLVIDLIESATGPHPGAIGRRFFQALQPFGATAINARAYPVPTQTTTEHVFARIAPAAFMPVYQEDRFFQDNPLPSAARHTAHPFAWSDIPWTAPGATWVRETMRDCGCPDGIIIPCHGPHGSLGVVSLAFTDLPAIAPAERRAIELAALYLHNRMDRTTPTPNDPGLTRRERDCLRFVAEGRTNAQIAAALNLSRATVATHLANARTKLGARTRAQAVAALLSITNR